MISDNPTKTRGIEKAWLREIDTRWAAFSKTVIAELKRINRLTVNAFDVDPIQLRAYIAYFQQQVDRILVGDWQNKYQLRAYELAISRAMSELKRSGARLGISRSDRLLAAKIESFTATSSLGITALEISSLPIHQETLEFLFTRSFESLQDMTSTMSRQVRQVLFESVEQGRGINETARLVRERIKVSKSRAQLIAQTETIQAFQRGSINQSEVAEDFLGEPILLRWLTRRDGRVRHLHAGFHGKIMTQQESRINISISPYRCRCGLVAVIKESNTEKQALFYDKQRQELKALTP